MAVSCLIQPYGRETCNGEPRRDRVELAVAFVLDKGQM